VDYRLPQPNSLLPRPANPQRLWSLILQEAERYTKQALSQLEAIWQQRHAYLSNRQQTYKQI
jgi:hypothetical protein